MPLRQAALLLLAASALTGCGLLPRPGAGVTRYVLPDTPTNAGAVFPEGVALRPNTQNFFVTSTTDGTIYRGTLGNPTTAVFLPGGADGRTTAVGLKADGAGRLFIAGGSTGRIFAYDADTGALLRAYSTPAGASFINDVALAGDYAYFTDSVRPVIFRVPRAADAGGSTAAEAWLDVSTTIPYSTAPGAFNLNGIAATPDGRYLIVVQSYNGKLFRIGVADRSVVPVQIDGSVVNGDGLLLDGQTLYVVRNADKIIVPISLAADFASGTIGTPFSDASLRYPTTIAQTDGRLLVVNSQFNKRGPGLAPELPFTVSSVPIPGK